MGVAQGRRSSSWPRRWVRRFANARVLIAGDLMLDHFVWGDVERISPEAPVPVLHVSREEYRLGGAANVMSNVRALGGRVSACGVVGSDAAGRQMLRMLDELDIDRSGVCSSRSEMTIRKTRVLAQQQQLVRLDRERVDGSGSRAVELARGHLLAGIGLADVVVLSDYGKGFLAPPFLQMIARVREERPFTLIIDPKDANFPHYVGASLVTPNRDEASRASGVEIVDAATLERAGRELVRRWRADAVLITRGAEGMSLFEAERPARHFPTVAQRVFDVTGAGDTVIATCALALAAGAELPAAAVLANHAAGLVVGRVGTASVTADEVVEDLALHGTVESTG